jgi:hypothetical protein
MDFPSHNKNSSKISNFRFFPFFASHFYGALKDCVNSLAPFLINEHIYIHMRKQKKKIGKLLAAQLLRRRKVSHQNTENARFFCGYCMALLGRRFSGPGANNSNITVRVCASFYVSCLPRLMKWQTTVCSKVIRYIFFLLSVHTWTLHFCLQSASVQRPQAILT